MITQGEVLDIASQAIYTIIMVSGSALIGVIDHRSDHQYLSDGDIHTGTDPYVCAEDSCRVCRNVIFGSWMLTQLTEYITDLWSNFGVFLS